MNSPAFDPRAEFTHKQLSHRAWRFGLTIDELIEVMTRNGGVCTICTCSRDMCVDHCHETGLVRDYICRNCNTEVGWYERGLTIYRPHSQRVIDYVERWRATFAERRAA